ncbi:MAG TPA: LamG-like jellyroll fold domain-containing protein [Streptosporangiaceae bacterium]|nr:LamG-like jellyroll fold domain-containing protein [Streptosporangiaceae bacterium]
MRSLAAKLGKKTCVVAAACSTALVLWPASSVAARRTVTTITIDGRRPGPVFDGIGAISGGGGNSRLLIDYPHKQRAQILNYLFGPGGADLQMLKLEIGGDANSSDGSEPSVEHIRGHIDCASGYEWWLAEQALARNPHIKLYGLQWAAPGWVSSVWSQSDIDYVIDWLNCARSHGLAISYLGGWNEHGYNIHWFESMRGALDAHGYRSVRLVAADAHPRRGRYLPATAWRVAAAAALHPALRAAISVLGAHDTCGLPTLGYRCESSPAARRLRRPLWESELGTLDGNSGAANLARSINHGYFQAGITGFIEWPLIDSMPPGLPYENRGLVTADLPGSGYYHANRIIWAIAQTTQFARPGWHHVLGANGVMGSSGSYNSYVSPNHKDWSLVAENSGRFPHQNIGDQFISVRLSGGLKSALVHVRETDLLSAKSSTWFVRRADLHVTNGRFSYEIPPGYVVSFTSASGQSRSRAAVPAPRPLSLPYRARPDGSAEAWGLASQEGAFVYRHCLGSKGGSGGAGRQKNSCVEQLADAEPVWWQIPAAQVPEPYAIVGSAGWASYTVSAKVLFSTAGGTARLIGRFGTQGSSAGLFTGYEFDLHANGRWEIIRDSDAGSARVLAAGRAPALVPGTWHAIAFGLRGRKLRAYLNGKLIRQIQDGAYAKGLAGIGSNWTGVQFAGLTVR